MLLTAFLLNDKPCIGGHGVNTVDVPLKIEETPTLNYQDVSSITNWYQEAFEILGYDYSFVRDQLIKYVVRTEIEKTLGVVAVLPESPALDDSYFIEGSEDPAVPNSLIASYKDGEWVFEAPDTLAYLAATEEEKRYLMELSIGDPYYHDQDFGQDVVRQYREEYHQKASVDRAKRMKRAETLIRAEIPMYQAIPMLFITSHVTDIDLGALGSHRFSIDHHKNFKQFGIRGTVEDFHPIRNPQPSMGLLDYVNSRAAYAGKGLRSMPWEPQTFDSMADLCDRITEILLSGN